MPSLTLARSGQISEPQECGPGTRITTSGSGYVEWTSGTLADVRNGVATWQRWPGGSAGDYCDTLRRLVFRGVASGSDFVVTWDEGKADPGPEGVYWQEQASSGSPVDAREFGVKADGVTDDTAALQAAVTAATTGGGMLVLPVGTIRITSAITIGFSQGWQIRGQGQLRTVIRQATSNTQIFQFTTSLTHSWRMEGIGFDWSTQQTSSEPNSVALYFDGGASSTFFNFVIQDCRFGNGYRGVALNPSTSQIAIWGVTLRDCTGTSTMSGAILRAVCGVAVGQPNFNLDNLYIDALGATEPSIQITAGNNVSLRCVEFNNGTYNTFNQISIDSSTAVNLTSCRSEAPVVSTAGSKTLWNFPNSDVALVGCEFTGPVCSGGGTLTGASAATNGRLSVVGLHCAGTRADGGSLIPFVASNIDMTTGLNLEGGWLANPRTALGNVEMPSVNSLVMTADATQTRGDVSVTLVATDYRVQYFNTTLTANRTVTLPNSGLQDGMEFHVIRYAGTPGAFTLQVVDGVSGKNYTIASGTKGFAKYRAVSTGEWLLIEAGTFP